MSAYFSHFICSYPAYIPFGGIKVRLTIYIRTNVLPFFSIVCSSYIFPTIFEGGNLAASKIRNLECPNYEICLIDYGCGKFNRKIHIMEQYP